MYPNLTQEFPIGLTPAPIDQTTDQKQRRLVVKHQNQFLLLDLAGGMPARNGAGLGLYVNDTRFLSQWHLTVGGEPLHFLSADADEGYAATLAFSNRAFTCAGGTLIPEGSISVQREIVLDEREIFSEKITLQNHLKSDIAVSMKLAFSSDFADMFEVRGATRLRRGYLLSSRFSPGQRSVTMRYLGRDNILRQTRINFLGQKASKLEDFAANFNINLVAQGSAILEARVRTAEKANPERREANLDPFQNHRPVVNHGRRFDFARLSKGNPLVRARAAYQQWGLSNARISTDNADFNRLLDRSYRDIYLLRQETPAGRAIAAGVPWFAVPFGRDSLIAGLQTLTFMPQLSADILTFLAAYQGKNHDDETCEKPGRIMHELRPGEMAGLAEIPFRPYYGTVDATQLWLMLWARYVQWTGDFALARKLLPNVYAALAYLGKNGYATYGGTGALTNQGWKDSGNCVVYANGELAKGPIAICEAQGYLYAAWSEVAKVMIEMGRNRTAARLEGQALALKKRFNKDFWMPELGTVALALDGEGRQCDVVASNAGHLLGTGILPPEREQLVASRLMQDDMFSGWGIRTLASSSAAYDPTDYQVGAVWPHDNGMIATGMYQIGASEKGHKVCKAMLDVALSQSDLRLPELFAGFERGNAKQPVPYQVACIPQLWAAGCVFHMVAGMLGLSYDPQARTLKITRPSLPQWIGKLELQGLTVGDAQVNLTFRRGATAAGAATVEITRVTGQVRCLVEC